MTKQHSTRSRRQSTNKTTSTGVRITQGTREIHCIYTLRTIGEEAKPWNERDVAAHTLTDAARTHARTHPQNHWLLNLPTQQAKPPYLSCPKSGKDKGIAAAKKRWIPFAARPGIKPETPNEGRLAVWQRMMRVVSMAGNIPGAASVCGLRSWETKVHSAVIGSLIITRVPIMTAGIRDPDTIGNRVHALASMQLRIATQQRGDESTRCCDV